MILKITFLICSFISPSAFGQRKPSPDAKAVMNLAPNLNFLGLFNGPRRISHARTKRTTNPRPTLKEMKYYNYWSASMYFQYQLNDLDCKTCQKFKKDVYDHTVIMNNDTDNTAIVAVSKTREEIVIAYRGTMNLWNLVLDLATIAVIYPDTPPGIKIHAGFHTALMSLYPEVLYNVGYYRDLFPDYKIVLLGHSLGGAMARLNLFYFLTLDQFPGAQYECYTFGEPRSGNKAYADFMNKQNVKTARVVNNGEIVPHLPPTSLLGTKLLGDYYYHCQSEYWYVDDFNQRFCDTTVYEDPTCSDSLDPNYNVIDHGAYLGLSYIPGVAGQPVPWAAIPFSILQPVRTIPPLPEFVADFNVLVAQGLVDLLRPLPIPLLSGLSLRG